MKKLKFWHFTMLLGFACIIVFISVVIIHSNICFSLKGSDKYSLAIGENYIEEGAVAQIFNKDISSNIKITGTVDTNKIGIYNINYKLSFLGNEYNLNRVINVIDTLKPEIELNGPSEMKLYVGENYIEEGVSVKDNYEASDNLEVLIEGSVNTNKSGEYIISYSVTDSSGNKNTITRKVTIEERKNNSTQVYDYNNSINKYIKDNNYDISIGYYNLDNGSSFYYRENEIYYGASLIKTLDAIYLYDNNMVTEDLKPYIEKAISVSDNAAHSYLVNYIGKNNLKNYGISLGASHTLSGGDNYGNTSVKDQIVYLKKLYDIIKYNEELKGYFLNDYGNYLNFNDVEVMHKYGYYGKYYHDVGIILDKSPYIIVVLTREAEKNKKDIINSISKLVYDYHNDNLK